LAWDLDTYVQLNNGPRPRQMIVPSARPIVELYLGLQVLPEYRSF